MNPEIKNCQNCKKDFVIEVEDFEFYLKIKVPAPTFCPDCRRQRRLAWFNLVNLFHRDCDLCGEKFISMYPPEAEYKVYCTYCWWSDKWDWRDYGIDYDFSKPYFDQFNEHLRQVPLLGLAVNSSTMSGFPYNNYATYSKDCYLTFNSDFNQECAYGVFLTRARESFDSSMIMECDSSYDCTCLYKSNKVIGGRGNNRSCISCFFIYDCENCQDCFMCINLRNKKYCFKNNQLTKEEYLEKIKEYNLNSYSGYIKAEKDVKEFWKKYPPCPAWDTLSVDCSGSYVFGSKNCHECYDVVDSEDCKYCMMLWRGPQKNCYDVSTFGYNIENIYEGMNIFENVNNVKFSEGSGLNLTDADYCKLSIGGKNHFGCVSVKKGNYVIFNKEYEKEEYYALRDKIISHMNELPYVDKSGNIFKYGEFFPIELSPFPYNKTFANLFYPKDKAQVENLGGWFLDDEDKSYKITKKSYELEDSINDVKNDILDEVVECCDCGKGYKIIKMELDFLRKNNLPIPRMCPFCRINEKLMIWVDNMTLKDRICDKCGKEFRTHYSKDRAPIVYCKECYVGEYF